MAGSELTLFMPGLAEGKTVTQRLERLRSEPALLRNRRLEEFLGELATWLRRVFSGPVTYAALIFEQVDWAPFDYIGLDHYREERVKDSYVGRLAPFLGTGKPVVVTEFGMRTYRGAQSSGALGPG